MASQPMRHSAHDLDSRPSRGHGERMAEREEGFWWVRIAGFGRRKPGAWWVGHVMNGSDPRGETWVELAGCPSQWDLDDPAIEWGPYLGLEPG